MDESTKKDNAGVRIPPPFVFVGFLAVGGLIDLIIPLTMGVAGTIKGIGALLFIGSIGIIIYISRVFKKEETKIAPWETTRKIIDYGIYAYSRNPIYVAMCCAAIGLGIIFNSYWILLSFIPSLLIVYITAIKKEETYLEKKFGQEYLDYKSKVRRWL